MSKTFFSRTLAKSTGLEPMGLKSGDPVADEESDWVDYDGIDLILDEEPPQPQKVARKGVRSLKELLEGFRQSIEDDRRQQEEMFESMWQFSLSIAMLNQELSLRTVRPLRKEDLGKLHHREEIDEPKGDDDTPEIAAAIAERPGRSRKDLKFNPISRCTDSVANNKSQLSFPSI